MKRNANEKSAKKQSRKIAQKQKAKDLLAKKQQAPVLDDDYDLSEYPELKKLRKVSKTNKIFSVSVGHDVLARVHHHMGDIEMDHCRLSLNHSNERFSVNGKENAVIGRISITDLVPAGKDDLIDPVAIFAFGKGKKKLINLAEAFGAENNILIVGKKREFPGGPIKMVQLMLVPR